MYKLITALQTTLNWSRVPLQQSNSTQRQQRKLFNVPHGGLRLVGRKRRLQLDSFSVKYRP